MGELVQTILDLLIELSADMMMLRGRLKTGVKTAGFCVFGGVISLFFIALAVQKWIDGDDPTGAFIMTLISVALLVGVIFGAIRGHKNKWKSK